MKTSFPLEVAVEIIARTNGIGFGRCQMGTEMLRRWGSNIIQYACRFLPLIQFQGTTATKSQHIPYL